VTSLANTPWMTEAVDALARELRSHHAPTADHSHRLATIARNVAERLSLGPVEATEVELVAVLHDVGKLTIDPNLLDWEGPLDEGQRARIRRHTIAGEELLAEIAGLEHLAQLVRGTHEAWDGSGYPDGLRGDELDLETRILAVADVWDALVSPRVYRGAWTPERAMALLVAESGTCFDARCVAALRTLTGVSPAAADAPLADAA
jgi:two-component system response regulator RpfG